MLAHLKQYAENVCKVCTLAPIVAVAERPVHAAQQSYALWHRSNATLQGSGAGTWGLNGVHRR
jgi:hypothetical protein